MGHSPQSQTTMRQDSEKALAVGRPEFCPWGGMGGSDGGGVSEEVSDPESDALSSVAMSSDVDKCSGIVLSPTLSLSGTQDPPAASWKPPLMTNNEQALPFTSPHLYYSFHYCNTIVTVCHPGL